MVGPSPLGCVVLIHTNLASPGSLSPRTRSLATWDERRTGCWRSWEIWAKTSAPRRARPWVRRICGERAGWAQRRRSLTPVTHARWAFCAETTERGARRGLVEGGKLLERAESAVIASVAAAEAVVVAAFKASFGVVKEAADASVATMQALAGSQAEQMWERARRVANTGVAHTQVRTSPSPGRERGRWDARMGHDRTDTFASADGRADVGGRPEAAHILEHGAHNPDRHAIGGWLVARGSMLVAPSRHRRVPVSLQCPACLPGRSS